MKYLSLVLVAIMFGATGNLQAQTAEEIVANYFENTGGIDNWRKLEGLKLNGKMKMQGMEIKMEVVTLKDARQYTKINFQGQEMMQGVYDGKDMWSVNFMTGQPEKMEAELVANFKKNGAHDFPDPLLDYDKKGYTVELLGKETMEGTECFKVKLTKNEIERNGKMEEVAVIYYFDTENFVPIAEEMIGGSMQGPPGQAVGKMISTLSDYQEVDGLFIPFTRATPMGEMVMETIVLNPEVEDDVFIMPEVAVEEKKN